MRLKYPLLNAAPFLLPLHFQERVQVPLTNSCTPLPCLDGKSIQPRACGEQTSCQLRHGSSLFHQGTQIVYSSHLRHLSN